MASHSRGPSEIEAFIQENESKLKSKRFINLNDQPPRVDIHRSSLGQYSLTNCSAPQRQVRKQASWMRAKRVTCRMGIDRLHHVGIHPRTRHRLWALHLGIVENLQVPSRHCIKNGLVPPRSRRSATKMLPPLRPDICKQLRINSGPGCEQRIFRDVRTLRSIHFHRSALINCFFAFNRLQRHSSTHLQGRNLANLSRPKRHVGTVEEGLFLVQVPGIVSKVPIVE
jgi:hypothetical protein